MKKKKRKKERNKNPRGNWHEKTIRPIVLIQVERVEISMTICWIFLRQKYVYLERRKICKYPTLRGGKRLFNRQIILRGGAGWKLEGEARWKGTTRFVRKTLRTVLDDNWCLHTPATGLRCSIISLSTVIPRPGYFSEIKFPAGPSCKFTIWAAIAP